MITSQTPHRISFFGGGTDYPSYYLKFGGQVLSVAIDKYCYLNIRHLPPFFHHKHRIVYSQQELVNELEQIRHPSVRCTLRYLEVEHGVSIHHDGDVPARSGLGSSSAFTVGLINGMMAMAGAHISKQELMQKAIHVEQNLIQEHVGSQDQAAAAFGGLNKIEFLPNGQIIVNPVILRPERLNEFERHLMLFYTGISRIASDIAKEQIERTEANLENLNIMKDMVDEAFGILISDGPLREFGLLLDKNWQLKKRLSCLISCSHIDRLYEKAKAAGALGGKVLGAGGGGFVLVFVDPELRDQVRCALSEYLHVPFQFDFEGSKIIVYRPETVNGKSCH